MFAPAPVAPSDTNYLTATVTEDQAKLVRSSWHVVRQRADLLTAAFYARLFEIDQSAARLFAGVDMAAQRAKLARALELMVETLDDTDALLPFVAALGKRHAHYGVEDHHFESVGQALIAALGETLGSALDSDTRAAWIDAYAIVASVMRRALIRAHPVLREEFADMKGSQPFPSGSLDTRASSGQP